MQAMLRAAFRISRLRGEGMTRVALAVDSETGADAAGIAHFLEPWRHWLRITDLTVSPEPPGEDWAAGSAGRAETLVVVTDRPDYRDAVATAGKLHGASVLDSDYPSESDPDTGLFHEVLHHQYELGGLNEFDGGLPSHSAHVLQHISTANSRYLFPQYMIEELRARFAAQGSRPLEAIDVGSGSISRLRWGALQGLLRVTGVDALLDFYEITLRHHGLDALPAVKVDRAISAPAEQIGRHLTPGSFDFAFCCNALDHVEDPPTVVSELAEALRPDACFALEFATREGTRQEWRDLHRFDLFLDERNEVTCEWRNGRRARLISAETPLSLDRVVRSDEVDTVVVLRRTGRRRQTPLRGARERLRIRKR
jgi:SAM-dependent methyltransferase